MKIYVELEIKSMEPNKYKSKVINAFRAMKRELYDANICKCEIIRSVNPKQDIIFTILQT